MRNSVADGVAAGSSEGDFKLLLTLPELRSIVGHEACARVLSALEADAPDAIALRRTTASSRWINFHTDAAARTVQASACSLDPCLVVVWRVTAGQVPLTGDGECEGGMLLFACSDGRLVHVRRRVGSIMAHDGDAVHGVTQLVKGIRCCAGERGMRLISSMCFCPPFLLLFCSFFTCCLIRERRDFLFLFHLHPTRYGLYALRGRS